MHQIQAFLAYVGPLLLIALKVGVVIGGTGSVLEAIGKWRAWPKLVAVGQKLEAIGADIPKLVGKIENLLPPAAVAGLMLLVLLCFAGCDPRNPPCNEANLKAIDEAYAAEVIATCLPRYDRKEDCPAFAGLQEKHRKALLAECPQ